MKKLSKTLSRRVKLTSEQLERLRVEGNGGEATKYNERGEYTLALGRKLNKLRAKAPKYVLYTDQLGRRLFLSNPTDEFAPITFHIMEARHFAEGLDEEQIKVNYYSQLLKLKFQTKRL